METDSLPLAHAHARLEMRDMVVISPMHGDGSHHANTHGVQVEAQVATNVVLQSAVHLEQDSSAAKGVLQQEEVAYGRMKIFCSNIIKRLAPPILKEVHASSLRLEAEPFTPRPTTRAAKRAGMHATSKATPAENVLLRALGLVLEDLEPDEAVVEELKELFDSPLREQHVRVIAAIFGKMLPPRPELEGGNTLALAA